MLRVCLDCHRSAACVASVSGLPQERSLCCANFSNTNTEGRKNHLLAK